jgi:hypothetical protein
MKYTKLIVGAVLMASAAFAGAADITTTKTISLTNNDGELDGLFDHTFTSADKGKTFLDVYNFTFASAADVAAAFSSPAIVKSGVHTSDLTFQSFNLYAAGSSTPVVLGSFGPGFAPSSDAGSLETNLAAGTYSLKIAGTVLGTKGGSYTGSVTVSPVPEPEAWSMIGAGLAAVGFVARRRKSKVAA